MISNKNESIFLNIVHMIKKLTLLIFLLPVVLFAQTEIKDGSIIIDFGKGKTKNDTIKPKRVQDDEYYSEPKTKAKKQPLIVEGQEEKPDFQRDGLFRALFIAGLNLSQIDGDEQAGYNYPGAHIGVGTLVKFHKNVSVSMELLYTMKGAYRRRNVNEFPQYLMRQQWDYVSVPLMLNIHDKKLVMLSAGLTLNYMVRNKLRYEVFDPTGAVSDSLSAPGYYALSREPRKFDLGGTVAFQFLIKQVLGIGARFEYSLIGLKSSVNPIKNIRYMHNNSITLRVMYILNPIKKKKR